MNKIKDILPVTGPKLLTVLAEGYGWADVRADLFAGLTVSVVALSLARMAGVPVIDSSGAAALKRLIARMAARSTVTVLCELDARATAVLQALDIVASRAGSFAQAIAVAKA